MKHLLFFFVLHFVNILKAQQPIALTADEWKSDLLYLKMELPKKHKNAFHSITKEQFESEIDLLEKKLPKLSNEQTIIELRRIVALIGDAHTFLRLPMYFKWYPIRLYKFGDEIRVVRTIDNYKEILGAKLTMIGSTKIKAAYKKIEPLVAKKENDWFTMEEVSMMLTCRNCLDELGLLNKKSLAPYQFVTDEGKKISIPISADSLSDNYVWLDVAGKPPLYLQNPAQDLWSKSLDKPDILYLNWKGYYNNVLPAMEKLLAYIDSNKVSKLIIDLRANPGGNFERGRKLIGDLKKKMASGQLQKVYVLIGRRTASAAVVNAMDMRKDLKAFLVGEPTGERPNTFGDLKFMELPKSKLAVGFSSNYYKFQEKDEDALIPDKLISSTWKAYKLGYDEVLEWVLSN